MNAGSHVIDDVARQRPPQQTARRVLRVHPLEIALAVEHGGLAGCAERRAADVPHDRVGDITTAIATQSGAIRQVDVLVRGEEIVVESSEFVEHRLRHQARGAAHAEHLLHRRRHGCRFAMMALERPAPAKNSVAGAVDDARIVHVDDA
jgi:hypothetical protein